MTLDEAREVLLLWEKLHPGTRPLTEALRTALAECDKLRSDIQVMVGKAADNKLDGYRELAKRAADAENESDRLRAARDEYHAQVRELRAKNERLRRDAERYRWLRDHHLQTGQDSWIRTGADLEEAIDAAIEFGPITPDELDAAK